MSCSVSLIQVRPQNVLHWWIVVSGLLKPAIAQAGPRLSEVTVLEDLKAGRWQLWLALDGANVLAALTTEVVKYRTGFKVCIVHLLGGEQQKCWGHLMSEIDKWAAENGCELFEAPGRKGLERMFPDWKPRHVFYERKVNG